MKRSRTALHALSSSNPELSTLVAFRIQIADIQRVLTSTNTRRSPVDISEPGALFVKDEVIWPNVTGILICHLLIFGHATYITKD